MTVVNKISEIKSIGSYEYNGSVINVTEVTDNGRLRGTCILPTGKEFSFSNSCFGLKARIWNDGVNPYSKTSAGKTVKVTFPAKVDNSQADGVHKIINAYQSASKQQKRFMKAYKLCKQASEVYGLTDVFSGMLEQLQQLDAYILRCEAAKVQQLLEQAKAEAEAKKAAEEAAKKQAELIQTIKNEQQVLLSYNMSAEQVKVMLEQKYGAEILANI